MTEPIVISTGSASAAIGGVTVVSLLPGLDPGVVIGAFAGAVIFVLSAADFPIWQRVFLFCASVVTGIYGAGLAASVVSSLLSTLLGSSISAGAPVGATLAAAGAVRVLMMFSARPRSPGSIFDRLRNKGGDHE